MLSRHVQHPITGELFHISSDIGKTILKEYLVRGGMWGGSDTDALESKGVEVDEVDESVDPRVYGRQKYLKSIGYKNIDYDLPPNTRVIKFFPLYI